MMVLNCIFEIIDFVALTGRRLKREIMRNKYGCQELSHLLPADLKMGMRYQLQGISSIGPVIDRRMGPEPYEWLAQQYNSGDENLHKRMEEIIQEFLDELPNPHQWEDEALANLFTLIQLCGQPLARDIDNLLESRRLLDLDRGGSRDLHARLLKCWLGLEIEAGPEFWMKQYEYIGDDYGALIFAGLIEDGLTTATNRLADLCRSEEAANWILMYIPYLIEWFGKDTVIAAFIPELNKISTLLRNQFEEQLQIGKQ